MNKALLLSGMGMLALQAGMAGQRPNVIFIFADQWRGQDVGYMGNRDVITPNIDRLASQSMVFTHAVSTCPVSGPYRGSLLTGTFPLTHGVFYNDKPIVRNLTFIGDAYRDAGYNTAYVGKVHVDGHGRDSFIPVERQMGFTYFKGRECTHDYNHSFYYADTPDTLYWKGYDAIAQTEDVIRYMQGVGKDKPFSLFLSWGPPHDPYNTAPAEFRKLYPESKELTLRPNVPAGESGKAQTMYRGYYSHIAALDVCVGRILERVKELGIERNTIVVFTSDHGDMLLSHGETNKQRPQDESILVPLLIRYPAMFGDRGRRVEIPIGTPDIMPTLLGISSVKIPRSVEGNNYAKFLQGKTHAPDSAVLIACYVPFHQWSYQKGGREYRGIRTPRYTYVRDLKGEWLLYDNREDPYQMCNLVDDRGYAAVKKSLNKELERLLKRYGDDFADGHDYMKRWGYTFDEGRDTARLQP